MAVERIHSAEPPLVRARSLCKRYVQRSWLSKRRYIVQALDAVDLQIAAGSTVALVGESGSGKSTLGRCLALLDRPDSGAIEFEGADVLSFSKRDLFRARARLQLILQDPAAALNPRWNAAELIAEPLLIQRRTGKAERRERALALMEQVGLSPRWAHRRPLEFSGGQRQRLAIARALALEPKFLILDEALSALDLSIQAQIVNLLLELQAARGLTYLYITHDLSLVGRLADQVAVMQRGRIVEQAGPRELFAHPQHPQTRALLAAIPRLEAALGAPVLQAR
jgi:ABC-type glutathione transport system ATPase component